MIKQYLSPAMYIKTWNNKIRMWQVNIEVYKTEIRIVKVYGYMGGNVSKTIEVREGCFKQNAINLIASKLINDKRNDGYRTILDLDIDIVGLTISQLEYIMLTRLSANLVDVNDISKPMKAKPFKANVMQYPAFLQRKINGVRCIISKSLTPDGLFGNIEDITIRSRGGIIYDVPHIKAQAALILAEDSEDVVLDGELYHHGSHVTSIAGAAKNKDNPLNAKLQFIWFDLAMSGYTQDERTTMIQDRKYMAPNIHTLETKVVYSDEEAINISENYIAEGYEGGIVRDMSAPYYFGGRRNNMLKIKKHLTTVILIIDIIPWDKDPDVGVFVCKNDINNLTFNCNIMDTTQNRKMYLLNKEQYIGRKASIKYYERTINGLPFHANITNIL